jgi:hypothetical protein
MTYKKTVVIGSIKPGVYYRRMRARVEVTIEIKQKTINQRDVHLRNVTEGKILRITGGIGTSHSILGSGQVEKTIRDHLRNAEFDTLLVSREELERLLDIWKRWHLNDMRAGCAHQNKLVPWLCELLGVGHSYDELMTIPNFQRCPSCGYNYGIAWLYEPLPEEVVNFLSQFGNRPWDKEETSAEVKT